MRLRALIVGAVLLLPGLAGADSPLTSTTFYRAYDDVALVKQAATERSFTDEIATFLSDPGRPIDEKAAVVNALGTKVAGTGHAARYTEFLGKKYEKSSEEIGADFAKILAPDEIFALGYLQALDDYFHPDKAIPLLEKAVEAKRDSYTAAMMLALTRAQGRMTEAPCEVWTIPNEAQRNKRYKKDMRQPGRQMIFEYVGLYRSACTN